MTPAGASGPQRGRVVRRAQASTVESASRAGASGLGPSMWLLAAVVLLGLGIRCIDLGAPLVDEQAWRQTDTAAIARNYFEEGRPFLYPSVDWRGGTPGYVEMEFPLYPYLVAKLYAAFGRAEEWIGRLVSALFSAGTIPLLFLLARRFYGPPAALVAAFTFTIAPMSAFFGRAFMPEPAMLFFSVGTILLFDSWVEKPTHWRLAGAVGFATLAFLVKVPTLYLGLPLLFLAMEKSGGNLFREPQLWAFALLTLVPTALWYRHAYALFQKTHLTFGIWNHYGYAKWGNVSLLTSADFYLLMLRRLGGVTLTPLGLALMVVGAALPVASRRERVFHVWLLALVLYVLLVPEGNRTLMYYQLPFVPVGAVFVGKALGRLWEGPGRVQGPASGLPMRRVAVGLCLGSMALLSVRFAAPLFAASPYYVAQRDIGREVEARVPKDALLVVGDFDTNVGAQYRTQSPTLLYYAHRKGWQLLPGEFGDRSLIDSLVRGGARFFLIPDSIDWKPNRASVSMLLVESGGRNIARFRREVRR